MSSSSSSCNSANRYNGFDSNGTVELSSLTSQSDDSCHTKSDEKVSVLSCTIMIKMYN